MIERVLGRVFLPEAPDWSRPPAVELEWMTSSAESLRGHSRRAAMREHARAHFEWQLSPGDVQGCRWLEARLRLALREGFVAAPYWLRAMTVLAVDGTGLVVSVDNKLYDARLGDVVYFRDGGFVRTIEEKRDAGSPTGGNWEWVLDQPVVVDVASEVYHVLEGRVTISEGRDWTPDLWDVRVKLQNEAHRLATDPPPAWLFSATFEPAGVARGLSDYFEATWGNARIWLPDDVLADDFESYNVGVVNTLTLGLEGGALTWGVGGVFFFESYTADDWSALPIGVDPEFVLSPLSFSGVSFGVAFLIASVIHYP